VYTLQKVSEFQAGTSALAHLTATYIVGLGIMKKIYNLQATQHSKNTMQALLEIIFFKKNASQDSDVLICGGRADKNESVWAKKGGLHFIRCYLILITG
jgi:hypothetical protein